MTKLTEKRLAALQEVDAGGVVLRWPLGRGEPYFAAPNGFRGLDARSLKWLRSEGLINHRMSGVFKVSEVYVTEAGRAALAVQP
ncbi:hypothetical protein ACX12M_18650 [Cellulosimicrobium cellulans]